MRRKPIISGKECNLKRMLVVIALLLVIQLAYSYTQEVHQFIGTEAQKYLQHISLYPIFTDTAEGSPHSRFIDGTKNEDDSDWIYGYGSEGGTAMPTISLPGVQNDLEPLVTDIIESNFKTITHFWDSDNPDEYQVMVHANTIRPNEFSCGPVPSAMTKAKKMIYGNGSPFFKEHSYSPNTTSLVVQLNDAQGIPGVHITLTSNSGDFRYKILSMDDFLIGHNIVIKQTGQWVWAHLSDAQFSLLRNSDENPEYEYLGRLCHLIMDMCVPSHVHNDMHSPALQWVGPPFPLGYPEWSNQDCDNYEGWSGLQFSDIIDLGLPGWDLLSAGGYLHDSDILISVWESDDVYEAYGYSNIPVNPNYPPQDYLSYYFYTVNQITQRFASEDVHGNDIGCNNQIYPLVNQISSQIDAFAQSEYVTYLRLTRSEGVGGNYPEVFPIIRDFCVPLAIRATSTLIDWWGTRYGYSHSDVQEVCVTGAISNPILNLSQTHAKITDMTSGVVFTSTISESGHFSITFNNPNDTHINLEIVSENYHPMFVNNILIPGHQNQSTEPLPVDIGWFTLEELTSLGLHVGRSGNSSFQSIEAAINYAFEHDVFRIQISGGQYSEKFVIFLPEGGFSNLELCGSTDPANPTQISSWGNNTCHVISVWGSSHLENLTLRNLFINGRNVNGGIMLASNIDEVLIDECTITNCRGSGLLENYNGAAIQSFSPTNISNCMIYNNSGIFTGDPNQWDDYGNYYSSLGVVYLAGNSVIELCDIYDNKAGIAGAVNLTGPNNIIRNNNIFSNRSLDPASEALAVRCKNAPGTLISNNIFYNNGCTPQYLTNGSVLFLDDCGTSSNNCIVKNNTFTNTITMDPMDPSASDCYPADLRAIRIDGDSNLYVNNNIITKYQTAISNNGQISSNQILHNNLFWKNAINFTGSTYDIESNTGNCLFDDPNIDANYVPIWNSSVTSPCIDAGIGDFEDGTPPDIGSERAIPHRYWEYSFTNQADSEKWHWVSYPILNSITDNALMASEFFDELLVTHQVIENGSYVYTPTNLDEIDWVEVGNPFSIDWLADDNVWTPNQNSHIVSSPQGYKIKLLQNAPDVVTLRESGLKTPATTGFQIHGGVENWIGYFKEEPALPHVAFASIWDDIVYIKAKNWSLQRANPIGDYYGMHGKVASLRFGDMVIIKTNNTLTFAWGNGSSGLPPIKADPKSFVYDEKQDYVPVYISIADSMKVDLNEIGLYVDGVCKGAVVVEDSLEQISAYVDSASELSEGNVEFVFCYDDNKGMGQQIQSLSLQRGRLQAKYGQAGNRYPYFEITLNEEEMANVVPPEFSLKQNYPNPFNPTTTITYSLPEAMRIRIDIYNLKGQLVKTLVNSEVPAGLHSVVWNSKDMNNVAVASGVYFSRISSPQRTQTMKMLLMK